MDPEHRKIELQSPADLTHLTTQLRHLARSKLDLHLPPSPDTSLPDDLRAQVESMVDVFVAQILAGMRSNISINGVDVVARGAPDENGVVGEGVDGDGDAVIEEFEAFDEGVRRGLGRAVQRRDRLIGEVSALRRGAAVGAARRWEEGWVRAGEELERERVEMVRGCEGVSGIAGLEALKRQGEVERNWERAVEGLERLNKGLPETRARLERCGEVVGYLGGKKEKE